MHDQVSKLYNLLKQKDLTPHNLEEKVFTWSLNEMSEFIETADSFLSSVNDTSSSLFSFTANASLSGEPFPCTGLECRLAKLDGLARFAALYGDKVFITNPFEKYLNKSIDDDDYRLRDSLVGDLTGLFLVRPLFDIGILSVRNSVLCLCKDCIRRLSGIETDIDIKLSQAYNQLFSNYINDIKVTFHHDYDDPWIRVQGPEELIEHGSLYLNGDLPESLINKYSERKNNAISKSDIQKYNLLRSFLYRILEDLFEQNVHVRLYKTRYLSDRKTDIQSAASANASETAFAASAVLEGLNHSIPNIANISISKLVELRQKEGEAFEIYRDSVYQSLKQAQNLSVGDASQLIDDTVRPAIHTIEAKVKNSRKLLVGSLKRDLLISSAFIGIGLFTGFLSADVGTLIGALGGLNFARSTVEAIHNTRATPEPVLDNPYYFLYKVKKTKVV